MFKIEIPGKEIEQNSTFYIYNIEGFLDIEKGLYFSLIELFETMKYCEKYKIDIKNYEDLEKYYDYLLISMKIINCVCDIYQTKNGETSEKEKKEMSEKENKEMSEKEKEEKCKCICEKKKKMKLKIVHNLKKNILNNKKKQSRLIKYWEYLIILVLRKVNLFHR